jgi:predicted Ser/Thr protein kinase
MALAVGAKLGPYEILAPIGAGGMGEVWQARDTRLDRVVAIKISKEKFNERFEREARAVAALNHPHICTLYDVGPDYLVMEYVEGQPLKGPLPLERAVEYARQILDALDAAHRLGIVHRDLKPANILLTKNGVKLLDFGLAKAELAKAISASEETVTQAITQEGEILGTLQYMAPEQLQGKGTDPRTDLFSFGCVLYEMLTGKRAFEGASAPSVIAAVLEREPAPLEVSPPLERVVRRALAKEPERRFQTAREVKTALEWAMEPEAARVAAQSTSMLPRAVAALFAVAVVLGFVAYFRRTSAAPQVLKVSVALPEKVEFGDSPPAVSPDGRRIAFVAHSDGKDFLWVRDLDTLLPRMLAGTDGADHPFWSPDSRFVGFFADGKLKKIAADGGPAVTLCEAADGGRGGSWSKRDIILFTPSPSSGVLRVPAAGGSPTVVKKPGRFPWFLPDGRHFLYIVSGAPQGSPELHFADLDSKAEQRILEADTNAVYAPPGYLLFMREGSLLAQPFDSSSGKTTGEAVPVAEQVGSIISNVQG